jgi:hypothetical protein
MNLVKYTTPPNWDQIVDTFDVNPGSRVLYAYAPHIYSPSGWREIPHYLIRHEEVHIARQEAPECGGPEKWWEHYCGSMGFRVYEELLAHHAEYKAYCNDPNKNRHERRAYLHAIAQRMSSDLYGCMIKAREVRTLLPNMDDEAFVQRVMAYAAEQ